MELFINGDPRFLSGGKRHVPVNYSDVPYTVETLCGGAIIETGSVQHGATADAVRTAGQNVHGGKVGYHHTPEYNVFLRNGEWPSAGIELETHLRQFTSEFARAAQADMQSNWFHFERDGSLDRDHSGEYGYELITEPLPPRAYRDQRLWTGLQNLCNPWLQSFQCEETGLHVHVGVNQFEGFSGIPLPSAADRRSIGKLLSTIVYYCVADQAFVDRVMLRRTGSYCSLPGIHEFTDAAKTVGRGVTGAALVDYCTAVLVKKRANWQRSVSAASGCLDGLCSNDIQWIGDMALSTGHSTEINQEHRYTIEFRRGKGTLHALSIHRMVELVTGIVRFAGKICREPDLRVTRESFMDWLIQTTTSEALRNLAKQTKGE